VTVARLGAIAFVFVGTSLAWSLLGASLVSRSGEFDGRLLQEVQLLWGAPHRQIAPSGWIVRPGTETETEETKDPNGRISRRQVQKVVLQTIPLPLDSTRATVDIDLAHRRKGLLWYPTYSVLFAGRFTFRNPDAESRDLYVRLPLPAENALFDDFVFAMNGHPAVPSAHIAKDVSAHVTAAPGEVVQLDVRYRSRGLASWTYAFAADGVSQVRDFTLEMRTNFADVDFPAGTVSPGTMTSANGGRALTWSFTNLISGQAIGVELPQRLNPGPFSARVTFFAPVSLLFFLAVMVIVGIKTGASLHPMHYWFIAAAFFAFHLLLAYLVDHVNVHVAFAASAAVSLLLVASYLRLILGLRRALLTAGTAQLIFLVLFSYAFFFEGFTGLSITVGAILTLFVLMQVTADVSWDAVFERGTGRRVQEDGHAARG
jgi:hypothetical protein